MNDLKAALEAQVEQARQLGNLKVAAGRHVIESMGPDLDKIPTLIREFGSTLLAASVETTGQCMAAMANHVGRLIRDQAVDRARIEVLESRLAALETRLSQ